MPRFNKNLVRSYAYQILVMLKSPMKTAEQQVAIADELEVVLQAAQKQVSFLKTEATQPEVKEKQSHV